MLTMQDFAILLICTPSSLGSPAADTSLNPLCVHTLFPRSLPLPDPVQACQRTDWPSHRSECTALVKYANGRPNLHGKRATPDSPVRALGRLVWAAVAQGEGFVSRANPGWRRGSTVG